MSTHDPISDLITRIRNAQMRAKPKVSTPGSKMRANVLEVLKAEGYIRGYASVEHASGRSELEIELKYFDGEPVIREIERVSKPGRRVYASVKNLPRVNNGLGILVLSTPKGIMADHEARDANVGGEILFTCSEREWSDVTYWQAACDDPVRCDRDGRRPDRQDEGPEGPASVRRP
jgi:small subunit ribosomal protein S8